MKQESFLETARRGGRQPLKAEPAPNGTVRSDTLNKWRKKQLSKLHKINSQVQLQAENAKDDKPVQNGIQNINVRTFVIYKHWKFFTINNLHYCY